MAETENIFTLTDEEGNESQFELIGNLDINGNTYVALVPVESENSEEEEYVVLKVEEDENGDEFLVTIDDDDEFDEVADAFEDQFMAEFDYDAADAGEDADLSCLYPAECVIIRAYKPTFLNWSPDKVLCQVCRPPASPAPRTCVGKDRR